MRVIRARRGSNRSNHLLAEAIAERSDDARAEARSADVPRALSATEHD